MSRGRPAPSDIVTAHADGLSIEQIAAQVGQTPEAVQDALDQHEFYCFGRLARDMPTLGRSLADDEREALVRRRADGPLRAFPTLHAAIDFLLRRLDEARAAHERRVTELLHANNAEVERRRAAERQLAVAGADNLRLAEALAIAEGRVERCT